MTVARPTNRTSPRTTASRPRARARAFTLPEVLATLLLAGIVLPAVMKGLSIAVAASDDARKRVDATALAENKLAELAAEALTGSTTGATSGTFEPEYPGFQWEGQSTVADVDLTELHVTVAWSARGGTARFVQLSSLVYTGAAGGTITSAPGGGQ